MIGQPQSSPAQPDWDGLIYFYLAESGMFVKYLNLTWSSSSNIIDGDKEQGEEKQSGRKQDRI